MQTNEKDIMLNMCTNAGTWHEEDRKALDQLTRLKLGALPHAALTSLC